MIKYLQTYEEMHNTTVNSLNDSYKHNEELVKLCKESIEIIESKRTPTIIHKGFV
jgi:hypothetical protein